MKRRWLENQSNLGATAAVSLRMPKSGAGHHPSKAAVVNVVVGKEEYGTPTGQR